MLSPVSAFFIQKRLEILQKTVRLEKAKLKHSLSTIGPMVLGGDDKHELPPNDCYRVFYNYTLLYKIS